MLKTRIITAVILIIIITLALYTFPSREWCLFISLITSFAAWEWGKLLRYSKTRSFIFSLIVLLFCIAPFFSFTIANPLMAPQPIHFETDLLKSNSLFPSEMSPSIASVSFELSGSFICFSLLFSAFFWCILAPLCLKYQWKISQHPLLGGLLGLILLFSTCYSIIIMRGHDLSYTNNQLSIITALIIIWIADSAAYFAGKKFGKHKLAPKISPGKTWEGVIGAAFALLIYAICINIWQPAKIWHYSPLPLVLLFFIMLFISITGDLFESMLKRQIGIKDSSNLLPGHGGILDRIDSIIAAFPLLVFILFHQKILANLERLI